MVLLLLQRDLELMDSKTNTYSVDLNILEIFVCQDLKFIWTSVFALVDPMLAQEYGIGEVGLKESILNILILL